MSNKDEFTVETPSGKSAKDENFPVASFLIKPELRQHIKIFYEFARAADDIADNPDLAPLDKVGRLEGFAAAIRGENDDPAYAKAIAMNVSLYKTGVDQRHCLDLLQAFILDARKQRYADWHDLLSYCALSAAPVGRYLLDLHGENIKSYPLSDGLCMALQILNHVQDCADDFRTLNRIYIPQDILHAHGADEGAFKDAEISEGLRAALTTCLDNVDAMLRDVKSLPKELQSKRLSMEAAIIHQLAMALSSALRKADPLAGNVVVGRIQVLGAGIFGGLKGIFA